MARVPKLSAAFRRARERCDVLSGSPAGKALARTINVLCESAELRAPQDTEVIIPPVERAHARRVPGHNLWLYYRATPTTLVLVTLTRTPPQPLH